MIWDNYVFRRGAEVEELWDQMFSARRSAGSPVNLLYVAGRGFDVRSRSVMEKFAGRIKASGCTVAAAKLLLIGFSGYQMEDDLHELTRENEEHLKAIFSSIGDTASVILGGSSEGEDDISATVALRQGADEVLRHVSGQTDIVLDVSSLPRIAYLTILLSLLAKVVPQGGKGIGLEANGLALQILVAEDPVLDSQISSEDPSNDLVLIPGYSEGMQSEALRDVPLVWFPILGENRIGQIKKIEESIPGSAEICPVLPHPSRNPRRGDELMVEYGELLFAKRETPLGNIIYAHEAHPFEVYRQLHSAMSRYRNTMSLIGGCRLVVTPLASKLITVGSALACFEMKLLSADNQSSVSIPYAEPKRYVADVGQLRSSRPEVSALLLTGSAYGG